MISIRTTLVVAGFVGMGLTSAVEHLADWAFADTEPFAAVDASEAMPGKALRLTENASATVAEADLSPWI